MVSNIQMPNDRRVTDAGISARRWSVVRHPAFAVLLLLFGIYLLSTGGHLYAIDEEQMFAATEALVLHGNFAIGGGNGEPPVYSQYGPGQSIAAVPWYVLGRLWASLWPAEAYEWLTRVAVSWFNPLITASVAALVVVAAMQLGYSRRSAVGVALLYGLATMAWPHSKTFFAEPLTALVVFGSFVLVVGIQNKEPRTKNRELRTENKEPKTENKEPRTKNQKFRILNSEFRTRHAMLIVSGLLAGLAATIKVQAGIVLPLLGLFVMWRLLKPGWQVRRSMVVGCVVWGVSALIPLALLGMYQYALFGSPLRTGYGTVGAGFTTPFWEGFNGQIWSPGRGILWYAPVTLLFPFGLWLMRQSRLDVALLCFAMTASHILFYATWWAWDGAGAWGPRFLNAVLPFAVLPIAAFLETLHAHRLRQFVLGGLLVATVPVQIAGLLINMNGFFSLTNGQALDYYRFGDSAIAGHWRLASDYAERLYDRFLAPESVALRSGFSYSEGGNAQIPRWTRDHAIIQVRAPSSNSPHLMLSLNGCAAPVAVQASIALNGQQIQSAQATCPARTYRVVMPPGVSTLTINATAWNPAAFGGERDETLGVRIEALEATVDNTALGLRGDQTPPAPMPIGHNSFRRWMTDHRVAQWDVWWWYFAHTRYPASHLLLFGALWLLLGLGCIIAGWRGLAQGGS